MCVGPACPMRRCSRTDSSCCVASICHSCYRHPQAFVLMRDTETIQNLKSILRGTIRIITDDSRAFIGTFVGTDKSLNILLLNTEEFRLDADANPAGRYVGQVMIPWRLIRDIGLQVARESESYSEQVRVRHLVASRLPNL